MDFLRVDVLSQIDDSESGRRATGWTVLILIVASILASASIVSLSNPQWFASRFLIPPVYDQQAFALIIGYSRYVAVVHLMTVLSILVVTSLYRTTFWLRLLPCVGLTVGLTIDIAGLSRLHLFPMHLESLLWLMLRAAMGAMLFVYALQLRPLRVRV